jgi:hypothetical protein
MSTPMLHLALLILVRAVLALIRGQDGRNWEPQLEALIREIGKDQ